MGLEQPIEDRKQDLVRRAIDYECIGECHPLSDRPPNNASCRISGTSMTRDSLLFEGLFSSPSGSAIAAGLRYARRSPFERARPDIRLSRQVLANHRNEETGAMARSPSRKRLGSVLTNTKLLAGTKLTTAG